MKALILSVRDSVAVALCDLKKGERISIKSTINNIIELQDDITRGHKFSLYDIKEGEDISKGDHIIGRALSFIKKGSLVYNHNMSSK